MILHVFNPEHDIALAHNDPYFTAPRAGRLLREDCEWLPALWAREGECVLVNNRSNYLNKVFRAQLVTPSELKFHSISGIRPWGWDSALVHQLVKAGVPRETMPSDEQLQHIRQLSSRTFAAGILREITSESDCFIGEATAVRSLDELRETLRRGTSADARPVTHVLKEPWSSSGRGLRYVSPTLTEPQANWAHRIIERQGALMVEPFYDKVADFGMEFESTPDGIRYRGLSVFSTMGGAYSGSLLASEDEKLQQLHLPHPISGLTTLLAEKLAPHLASSYAGPFGIDMMVARTTHGEMIHPMVEINLRRTMGHVAIDLYERGQRGTMSIAYDGKHYELRIK